MPFDIKTIESPTHKVKIKVSGKLCTVQGTLNDYFTVLLIENCYHGNSGAVSRFHPGGGIPAASWPGRDPRS